MMDEYKVMTERYFYRIIDANKERRGESGVECLETIKKISLVGKLSVIHTQPTERSWGERNKKFRIKLNWSHKSGFYYPN